MKFKPKIRFTPEGRMETWAPPRPRVGAAALQHLLMRHVTIVCPESELWVAVIAQAMVDAINRNDLVRHRARHFLTRSRGLHYWCHLIGIEVEFVREVALKTGYLVDEHALWQPVKSTARRPRQQTAERQEAVHA